MIHNGGGKGGTFNVYFYILYLYVSSLYFTPECPKKRRKMALELEGKKLEDETNKDGHKGSEFTRFTGFKLQRRGCLGWD